MRLHSAPGRSLKRTRERLIFQGETIVAEWHAGTRGEHRETDRPRLRVACDRSAPGRNCRLRLGSHGRETEAGQYRATRRGRSRPPRGKLQA